MQQYHTLADILNLNNKTSATTTTMGRNGNVFAISDKESTDTDHIIQQLKHSFHVN